MNERNIARYISEEWTIDKKRISAKEANDTLRKVILHTMIIIISAILIIMIGNGNPTRDNINKFDGNFENSSKKVCFSKRWRSGTPSLFRHLHIINEKVEKVHNEINKKKRKKKVTERRKNEKK